MLIFPPDSQAGALTRSSFLQENPLRKRGLRLIYILVVMRMIIQVYSLPLI